MLIRECRNPTAIFAFLLKCAASLCWKVLQRLKAVFLLKNVGTTFFSDNRGHGQKTRFLHFSFTFYFYVSSFHRVLLLGLYRYRPISAQYTRARHKVTVTQSRSKADILSWSCLRLRSASRSLRYISTNSQSSGIPVRLFGILIISIDNDKAKSSELYYLNLECSIFRMFYAPRIE